MNNKTEKNRRKRNKQKARRAEMYAQQSWKWVQESQTKSVLEDLAIRSGLKYETVKDLVGLNFN